MSSKLVVNDQVVKIRKLKVGDLNSFLNLKKKALEEVPESFIASQEDETHDYKEEVKQRLKISSIKTGDIILGAFSSSNLVGITSITQEKPLKRRHKAELHGMYVIPEFRSKGVGRILLSKALEKAKTLKQIEEIHLIVATKNKGPIKLYEKFGFETAWIEKEHLR